MGVIIDGESATFDYRVRIIDPAEPTAEETVLAVAGPSEAPAQGATRYDFPAVPHAIGYELRTLGLEDYGSIDDAETGLGNLIDRTDPGYPVRSIDYNATTGGQSSFHLAHNDTSPPTDQGIDLAGRFLVGPDAVLSFASRLSWATDDQIVKAQVSTDDGATWSDIYTQTGAGGQGETAFTLRQIPLSDYLGLVVMIRFVYIVDLSTTYSWYGITDEGFGLYLDDIQLSGVQRVTSETLDGLGNATGFDLQPAAIGHLGLQVRLSLWDGYPALEWGPVTEIEAIAIAPVIAVSADLATENPGETLALRIDYGNQGSTALTAAAITLDHDPAVTVTASSHPPDQATPNRWSLDGAKRNPGLRGKPLIYPGAARPPRIPLRLHLG